MQNRFLPYFQTSRRLSVTNWSWNPQGFWFTISQAARASGLETIFQLLREMIKIMQMYQQVWRWEVLCGQAVGWSQLQPCAWGDPLQLCLCLSRRHAVCRGGVYFVLRHDCLENLVLPAGEQLCLSDWSGCLNGLPHSHIPTLPSSATTERSHRLVY